MSDITEQIKAYRAGATTWPALKQSLSTREYATPAHFGQRGLTEADLESVDRHEPGTWGEVEQAHNEGLLTDDEMNELHGATVAAHGG